MATRPTRCSTNGKIKRSILVALPQDTSALPHLLLLHSVVLGGEVRDAVTTGYKHQFFFLNDIRFTLCFAGLVTGQLGVALGNDVTLTASFHILFC